MTYEIFEGNMERLGKKLATIRRKCEKYGCEFHFEEVGETYRKVKQDDGTEVVARFVVVEAEGKAKLNDWEFVATLEHTENGNLISGIGTYEVPSRYYTAAPMCEHCNSTRVRKNTYIVRNAVTGEFKQVGRSCLKDFTNGLSAEAVAQYLSFFEELVNGEQPEAGYHCTRYFETEELLQYAAETVLKFGYTPRDAEGRCTADRAEDYLGFDHGWSFGAEHRKAIREEMEEVSFDANSQEAAELVNGALAWIAEQDDSSNYIHNLKVVTGLRYTVIQKMGLLASLFAAYNRELERKAKKEQEAQENRKSGYVGRIGDKVQVEMVSITVVTGWETQWGYTRIYKMVDKDGNIYTWKTSNFIEQDSGVVKGTIKDHNEYRGTKQTELTRCRVA